MKLPNIFATILILGPTVSNGSADLRHLLSSDAGFQSQRISALHFTPQRTIPSRAQNFRKVRRSNTRAFALTLIRAEAALDSEIAELPPKLRQSGTGQSPRAASVEECEVLVNKVASCTVLNRRP